MNFATIKPHLLLLVANATWAIDFPLYKIILPHDISPYALTSMVLIFSGLACLVSFIFYKGEKIEIKDIYKFAVAGILMGMLKKGFLMVGMCYASPIDASIINTAGPVIVLIVSSLFLIDKISKRKLFGICLGVLGTMLVVLQTSSTGLDNHKILGNTLIFIGTICSALYMVWLKDIVKKYKPLTIMRWMYMMAALFTLPFGIYYIPQVDFAAMSSNVIWILLFVIIVPTLIPNYFIISSSRFVKPTIVSVYEYVQPIIATGISVAIGLDVLTWQQVLAAITVFVGVYFVISSYKKDPL